MSRRRGEGAPLSEPDAYEPAIDVESCGGCIVMLTVGDGEGEAQVYLSKREAHELAAAVEYHAALAARGENAATTIKPSDPPGDVEEGAR